MAPSTTSSAPPPQLCCSGRRTERDTGGGGKPRSRPGSDRRSWAFSSLAGGPRTTGVDRGRAGRATGKFRPASITWPWPSSAWKRRAGKSRSASPSRLPVARC